MAAVLAECLAGAYLLKMSKQETVQPKKPTGESQPPAQKPDIKPREHGGPPGPEPTRYGDWEKNGRCIDF